MLYAAKLRNGSDTRRLSRRRLSQKLRARAHPGSFLLDLADSAKRCSRFTNCMAVFACFGFVPISWMDPEKGVSFVLLTTKPAAASSRALLTPVSDVVSEVA